MERFVLIGGYAEAHSPLKRAAGRIEPVIQEELERTAQVIEALDPNLEQPEVFTIYQAEEAPEEVELASKGALVITHSLGASKLTPSLEADAALALNGPEPRSITGLIAGAARKSFVTHPAKILTNPDAVHVLAHGTGALLGNIRRNLLSGGFGLLGEASEFSTLDRLQELQAAHPHIKTGIITAEFDEFFPPLEVYEAELLQQMDSLDGDEFPAVDMFRMVLGGRHDDIFVKPADTLAQIGEFVRTL